MKSIFALFLVLGLVFHPAFLIAAEEAPAPAAAAETDDAADLDAGLEDWELEGDDLATEDEDLALDEEELTAEEAAAAPAADAKKV